MNGLMKVMRVMPLVLMVVVLLAVLGSFVGGYQLNWMGVPMGGTDREVREQAMEPVEEPVLATQPAAEPGSVNGELEDVAATKPK